jgi:hypothetical protein
MAGHLTATGIVMNIIDKLVRILTASVYSIGSQMISEIYIHQLHTKNN